MDAPALLEVFDCNCTICRMTAFQHLIVPATRFRLLAGHDVLSTYSFNTGTARHLFCSRCGIKSYYIPRSHPDGFSVNVRCLDRANIIDVKVTPYDGLNWGKETLPALQQSS